MKQGFVRDLAVRSGGIVCLQETHCERVGFWPNECQVASYGSNRGRGCCILFPSGVSFSSCLTDDEGRVCSATVGTGSARFRIVCVYAPNNEGQRRKFFTGELLRHCSTSDDNIVVGDFNCVRSLRLDHTSRHTTVTGGYDQLYDTYSAFGLKDAFRSKYPDVEHCTWTNRAGTVGGRLDRFYIPTRCQAYRYETSHVAVSDHRLLTLVISDPDFGLAPSRGEYYWKCNVATIEDRSFQAEFRSAFKWWLGLRPLFESVSGWWERIKVFIKFFVMRFSARTAQLDRDIQRTLERELAGLDSLRDAELVCQLKQRILAGERARAETVRIQSRVQDVSSGDRPTAYFYRTLREKRSAQRIDRVVDSSGRAHSDMDSIKSVYHEFYTSLYTRHQVSDDSWQPIAALFDPVTDRLDQPAVDSLVGSEPFDTGIVVSVIKCRKRNRSPGPDGLPAEFYKEFSDVLAPVLRDLYNEISRDGVAPRSMRSGITVLLPKSGDQSNPANKRPITLLNVDYKILARCVGDVLAPMLKPVVSATQTCSVPGRSMVDNLVLLRDIQASVFGAEGTRQDRSFGFVSLDQRKAFDLVNQGLLFDVLERLNVPASLLSVVRAVYTNAHTRIMLNGFLTDPVRLERGVRQGCPLSPLLYVVYIELLVRSIDRSRGLTGYPLPGLQRPLKCLAYADDILAVCPVDEFGLLFDVVRDFAARTGSDLNFDKTKVMCRGQSAWPQFQVSMLRVCGIYYSVDPGEDGAYNFGRALTKLQRRVRVFEKLHLSLPGKVLSVQTVLYPLFHLAARVYPAPAQVIRAAVQCVFKFIWHPAIFQPVAQAKFCLGNDLGGWALSDLRLLVDCFFLHENCLGPALAPRESHPRYQVFVYHSAGYLRRWLPEIWSNSQPHSFEPAPYYKVVRDRFASLSDDHDRLRDASRVGAVYRVLSPTVEPTGGVKIVIPTDRPPPDVWRDVFEPSKGSRNIDFLWRVVSGSLKTGELVARFNKPGARLSCVFCTVCAVETAVHLFTSCTALSTARAELLRVLAERDVMGDRGAPDFLLAAAVPSQEGRFLVSEFNRGVWAVRNDVLFGDRAPDDPVARVLGRFRMSVSLCDELLFTS